MVEGGTPYIAELELIDAPAFTSLITAIIVRRAYLMQGILMEANRHLQLNG